MPPKRIAGVEGSKKRTTITLAAKMEILRKVDANPQRSKTDLAAEMGLKPTTLYTIIKDRQKIQQSAVTGHSQKTRKRVRAGKFERLEEKLVEWIRQCRTKKIPVSGVLVIATAKRFALRENIIGFRASNGWLARFRKRHNILFSTLHGESADVDEATVSAWKNTILPRKVESYAAKDIYNADECGLFFNVLPDKTLALDKDDTHGGKSSKARITVLLAANGDGSDKLTPFVIGKSVKPRCFKNIRTLPCTYKSQPKAWMTGALFIEWLKQVDGRMRAQRLKILLFIDNCPAHPTDLEFLTNVRVEFFPKNCTSVLQPLDQGVIHNFKYYYRKRVVLRLMNFVDQPNATKKDMMLNILHALHFLQWAWLQVKPETIKNCFRHAGFHFDEDGLPLPPPVAAAMADAGADTPRRRTRADAADGSYNDEELAEQEVDDVDEVASEAGSDSEEAYVIEVEEDFQDMWTSVAELFGAGDVTVEQFICFDDSVLTHEPLTEEQIMNMGSAEDETEDTGEDVEDDEQPDDEERKITQAEGLRALGDVRLLLSQLPEVEDDCFGLISKLESIIITKTFKEKKQSKISDFFKVL